MFSLGKLLMYIIVQYINHTHTYGSFEIVTEIGVLGGTQKEPKGKQI
jgi:hypothetical protein